MIKLKPARSSVVFKVIDRAERIGKKSRESITSLALPLTIHRLFDPYEIRPTASVHDHRI